MSKAVTFTLAVVIFQASPCSAAETHANWQCGRNYIEGTSLYGSITYPNGESSDIWLNPGPPPGSPVWDKIDACIKARGEVASDACIRKFHRQPLQWRGGHCDDDGSCDWGTLYYRGKPCKKMPVPSEPEQKSAK